MAPGSPSPSGSVTHLPHRYNTRQAAVRIAEVVSGRLEIRTVPKPLPQGLETLAASTTFAQKRFLEGVGVLCADEGWELEQILDVGTAQLLSCALQHRKIQERIFGVTDPYFTDEQKVAVIDRRCSTLIADATDVIEGVVTSSKELSASRESGQEWLQRRREIPLCKCVAHTCPDVEFYTDVLGVLITMEPPLNDDSGTIFANLILTYILKAANWNRIKVHGTRGGMIGLVEYILQLPSGVEYMYRGRPNYLLYQRFTQEERGLGLDMRVEESVRGIGEVQSQRGTSTNVKNQAFAQAGIYTLGYFTNVVTRNKLVTVIIYKDMMSHVAFATFKRENESGDILGEVSYKLAHSLNPFDLRNADDLQVFASVFIAALKSAMTT